MPVLKPVGHPPFEIVRTGYVEFRCVDLAHSKAFWVDALGWVVTEETKDALYLRGFEERTHHSVVLHQATEPSVSALGFKVQSEEDLDRAEFFFQNKNLPHRWIQKPAQGRTLSVHDPLGMPLEFYFEMTKADCLLRRYGLHRGAMIQRIDHVNCFTPEVQCSYDFFNELGFRTTEYTETEDGRAIWAVWLQRKGNVHDIAFTSGRGPRLHHVGVWVPSCMDIIHTCDALATSGWLKNMERGPGRHGISNAFFLYLRDPDGHRVELFTSDYLAVDPDFKPLRWDLRDPQRQTLWGAPAPKSWFEEGTPFIGQLMREPSLRSEPLVAP